MTFCTDDVMVMLLGTFGLAEAIVKTVFRTFHPDQNTNPVEIFQVAVNSGQADLSELHFQFLPHLLRGSVFAAFQKNLHNRLPFWSYLPPILFDP